MVHVSELVLVLAKRGALLFVLGDVIQVVWGHAKNIASILVQETVRIRAVAQVLVAQVMAEAVQVPRIQHVMIAVGDAKTLVREDVGKHAKEDVKKRAILVVKGHAAPHALANVTKAVKVLVIKDAWKLVIHHVKALVQLDVLLVLGRVQVGVGHRVWEHALVICLCINYCTVSP